LERPLETHNRLKTLGAIVNPNIFVPEKRIGASLGRPSELGEEVAGGSETNRTLHLW
jgi:hypothetical protein